MKYLTKLILIGAIILALINCSDSNKEESAELKKKIDQYKTVIKYDGNLLDDRQKVVVNKLYQAANGQYYWRF